MLRGSLVGDEGVVGGTTETYNYASTSNRLNTISVGGSTVRSFSYANSGQVLQNVRGGSPTYDFTYNKDGRLCTIPYLPKAPS